MKCDNPQLEEVRKTLCHALSASIVTQEKALLEHINKTPGGKKTAVSFPIKIDMAAREIDAGLNFSEKHSCPLSFQFDDPNQVSPSCHF